MRTSSYTIYVDLPDRSDSVLLVHGYSGAYDIVANDVADYLRSRDQQKPPKPLFGVWTPQGRASAAGDPPPDETLSHLQNRGYLTEMTVAQELDFLTAAAERLHQSRRLYSPIFVLMPTYDCNLRCHYCFQDYMRAGDADRRRLQTMSIDMADRLLTGMADIEARHSATPPGYRRSVGLFGGEPMLRASRPLIEHLVRRLKDAGPVSLWAATNGAELDAYFDLLGPDGIETLQITLDGTPEEHDKRRVYADGTGTFAAIARNMRAALERGVAVQARVNVDRNNIALLPAVARIAQAEGWTEFERFDLHAAPINAVNDQTRLKDTYNTRQLTEALDKLKEQYPEMSAFRRQDAALEIRARRMMTGELDGMAGLKAGFCGAHDRMYILDAFADVYACWERTGDPERRIGRIDENGVFRSDDGVRDLWRKRSAVSNPVCAKCRYVLYCGGGCAVLAEHRHGDLYTNFCDEYANRFRRHVAEAYLGHISAGHAPAAAQAACGQ
jgi:uncharacterized protein